MAYTAVTLPLTGAGDATAAPAVDLINGQAFQAVKLFDGTEGSTVAISAKATTPDAADAGMIVRPIGSSAFNQAVVGAVGITSGSSAVELTSVGSTRLAGRFTVDNPTTAVSLSSQHTVTVGNPTTAVSLSSQPTVSATGTTTVEANLTSAGSTRSVGTFNQGSPAGTSADAWWVRTVTTGAGSTVVSMSSQITVTASGTSVVDANLTSVGSTKLIGTVSATGTTKVDVSSGVILGAGSTANSIGAVALVAGTTANTVGSVALVAGSSANVLGSVTLAAASTGVVHGAVAVTSGVVLGAGSSANVLGAAAQGPGSSANFWYSQPLGFTSALTSRSSIATSVDIQVVAASSARLAMVIANRSTAQTVGVGYSTGAVTTGLANVDVFIQPSGFLTFGYSGGLPLYLGPLRAINLTSTAVAGSVAVTQFLSS